MDHATNMKKAVGFLLICLSLGVSAAEWIVNGDFENGTTAPWFPLNNENVRLVISKDSLSPGGGCGALSISNTENVKQVSIVQSLKKQAGPGRYKFRASIDTGKVTQPMGFVSIRLTGSVHGKYESFCSFNTKGSTKEGWKKDYWTEFEKIITVPEGGVIKNVTIYLSNISGTVMADNISLQDYGEEEQNQDQKRKETDESASQKQDEVRKNAPVGQMETVKYRSLYPFDETPELCFRLKNPSDREVTIPVHFQTHDYFGNTVKEFDKNYLLAPGEEIREILRYPECTAPGFFAAEATWDHLGSSGSAQASFVKVGPVPARKDPLFGINYFTKRDTATWNLLGAGSKGILFRWQLRLPHGKKDLERICEEVEELHQNGITVVGAFRMYDGTWWTRKNFWKTAMIPELAQSGIELPSVQDCEKFLTPFIEEVVTREKPYITHWVCSGEIDCGYLGRPDGIDHYVGMIRFTADAIHRADPEAIVASLGVSGGDGRSFPRFPWIRKLLPQVKDCLDALSPDAYTGGQRYGKGYISVNTEESQNVQMMKDLLKIARDTRKKVAWIDERGPSIVRSTPLNSPYGIRMANMVAREFIQLKSFPDILFWLYYRPDNSATYAQSTFDWGMWEKEFPRQVVSAYAATARIMAFAEFIQELPLHQDLPCRVFRKDGRCFAAVWYNGEEKLKVELPADIPVEALDVQGNPIPIQEHVVYFGEAPVYLFAKDEETLENLLRNAGANISELKLELDSANFGKTMLTIQNVSGHPITVKLDKAEVSGTDGSAKQTIQYSDSFKLAAREFVSVEKALSGDFAVFHLETEKGRKYTVSGAVKAIPVPLVNSFEELESKAVPLMLNDPAAQMPGYDDLKVHGIYTGPEDLSAAFRVGYDKRHLYLEVRVKDDTHLNSSSGGRIFDGDCVQFALDTRRDAKIKLLQGVQGYSDDDFNFVSALASGKPATYCYIASSAVKDEVLDKTYGLVPEITRDEESKTTLYRIKIDFAHLAPLKPEKGRVFGFSLVVFDKDPSNPNCHIGFSAGVTHPFDPAKYPAFQFE